MARGLPTVAIYRDVLPFVGADLVRPMLVAAFPALALALVRWLA